MFCLRGEEGLYGRPSFGGSPSQETLAESVSISRLDTCKVHFDFCVVKERTRSSGCQFVTSRLVLANAAGPLCNQV